MSLNFWIDLIEKEWDNLTEFPILAGILFCGGATVFFIIAKFAYKREISSLKAESSSIKAEASLLKTERDELRQEIDQKKSLPQADHLPDGKFSDLFGEISTIYNDIGLLVQSCYNAKSSKGIEKSNKVQSLSEFFIENLTKNRLSLSKDMLIIFEKLFDALSVYKRRADFMISSIKNSANYDNWKEMNTDFNEEVVPLFNNLENRIRDKINHTTQPPA